MYSVSTFFRLIQYKREGIQLHFHFEFLFEQLSTIKLFQCFHIQIVVVPFLRNNPSAVMFFQRFIFPYSVSTFFRLIQYKREGMQLHFHISRHIAHLGWETPVFFLHFLPCLHMALSYLHS
jgi:hypothetical protein